MSATTKAWSSRVIGQHLGHVVARPGQAQVAVVGPGPLEAADQGPEARRVDEVTPAEVDDHAAAGPSMTSWTSRSRSRGAVATSTSPARRSDRPAVAVLDRDLLVHGSRASVGR